MRKLLVKPVLSLPAGAFIGAGAALAVIVPASPALAADPAAGSAFPPFDASTFAGQLFWLAITFGLLYRLMSRIALPRIASIMDERRETIDTALRAANVAQKSAEEASVAHEQALAKAKASAQAIAQDARVKSAKDIETERVSVEKELSGKLSAAETRISEMKTRAMANVETIAADTVGAMIEQLTGKAPKADEISAAIAATTGK